MASLFHYTKTSTLIDNILSSRCLKTNNLSLMNDPREVQPWAFGGVNLPLADLFAGYYSHETHIDCQYKFGKLIKNKFQVICFSGASNEGWNNEMMWAHYGQNHQGVCLQFDEPELIKTINNNLRQIKFSIDDISYNQEYKKPYLSWDKNKPHNDNLNNIIEKCKPILLTKSHFWEKEDERRLSFFQIEESVYIPIFPSLKAIYLGTQFCHDQYLSIIEELTGEHDVRLFDLVYQHSRYEKWQRSRNSRQIPISRKYR